MNTIRETYLSRLKLEFDAMAEKVIRQSEIARLQLGGDFSENLVTEIEQNELTIDQMEVKLRDDIVNSIVLQSPRAGDLRRIISYYDTVVDLERIADIFHSISHRMHYLLKENSIYPLYKDKTLHLFEMALTMLQNAIFALTYEDIDMARSVILADEEMDKIHRTYHKELFEQKQDENHPHWVADLLDLGRILYGMERIGDGATNIAEAVIFLSQGKDIRHSVNSIL